MKGVMLQFVSLTMVFSYFLSIVELISCVVCSSTIGCTAYFSLILLMFPLSSCSLMLFCFAITRRGFCLLLIHAYSYLWTAYIILADSIILVTCSSLLIIPTCSITFDAYASPGMSSWLHVLLLHS